MLPSWYKKKLLSTLKFRCELRIPLGYLPKPEKFEDALAASKEKCTGLKCLFLCSSNTSSNNFLPPLLGVKVGRRPPLAPLPQRRRRRRGRPRRRGMGGSYCCCRSRVDGLGGDAYMTSALGAGSPKVDNSSVELRMKVTVTVPNFMGVI